MPDLAVPEIKFGRIARTITYNDSQGALVFTFDFASRQPDSDSVWTVILDSGAALGGERVTRIDSPSEQQIAWIRFARERVIEYLRSRPYHVVDAEATNRA
jgi:hypothetical protein